MSEREIIRTRDAFLELTSLRKDRQYAGGNGDYVVHHSVEIEQQERWVKSQNSPDDLLRAPGFMDSRKHCAYNQTQECFLGLEVSVADLSYAGLEDLMARLALKPGEGLWMAPFRGIRAIGMLVPLDLVYLDENCRVLETVERFPSFRGSLSSERAASVLALPAHSISSSQTQPGDQLVLCVAEEMDQRLENLHHQPSDHITIHDLAILRDIPLWSRGADALEMDHPYGRGRQYAGDLYEMALAGPEAKMARAPKPWLYRWWSHDPRNAPPAMLPGHVAYYWNDNGERLRDMRSSGSWGLYAVVEDEWSPATLMVMTASGAQSPQSHAEYAISVQSRGIRRGETYVGIQFLFSDEEEIGAANSALRQGALSKEFDRILDHLRSGPGRI